jgi:hypothetical protein
MKKTFYTLIFSLVLYAGYSQDCRYLTPDFFPAVKRTDDLVYGRNAYDTLLPGFRRSYTRGFYSLIYMNLKEIKATLRPVDHLFSFAGNLSLIRITEQSRSQKRRFIC